MHPLGLVAEITRLNPPVRSWLFVPVNVEGALFMAADAHGLQGDGEVSCLACETYFEEVELEFVVRRDMTLERPMAETPSGRSVRRNCNGLTTTRRSVTLTVG